MIMRLPKALKLTVRVAIQTQKNPANQFYVANPQLQI